MINVYGQLYGPILFPKFSKHKANVSYFISALNRISFHVTLDSTFEVL